MVIPDGRKDDDISGFPNLTFKEEGAMIIFRG